MRNYLHANNDYWPLRAYGMSGDGDACLEVGVEGSPLSWHEPPKAPTA